ncbi:hypothetical protein LEM8419_00653 [Neolewinella maritima]|uniref:DUF4249 domain-containing protein n=1 Tax=Neolewinella maritima TaxID=1383882 RepID=A0ABM9AYR3_9BACT|nr:DUF4249 family protein [Neolewinella maritima]CAH0999355.1 hypothetical protein LEM8419_00653 [Neolewinella maritima]
MLYARCLALIVFTLLCTGCIEPTEPVFRLEQPFYLVEGELTDQSGQSQLTVRQSNFSDVQLTLDPISDATVLAEEEGAGTRVQWQADPDVPGTYRAPADFAVQPGERWFVNVRFPDGTEAISAAELLPAASRIDDFRVAFEQEGRFVTAQRRFVPVFRLLLDFTDPEGTEDYYEWNYRYWEQEVVCASCDRGVYREGECIPVERFTTNNERYDYLCESSEDGCFRQRGGNQLDLSTDQAFAGGAVQDRPIGEIDFTDFGGILIEAIQYGLTAEAYAYGKVAADIVRGSSGLNATLPAALNGNVRNLDPDGPEVLGNVRVASRTTRRLFFVRDATFGEPPPRDRTIRLEPSNPPFTPPQAPCSGNGRTPIKPDGWPD